jgi:phosphopantothenoylcysteine decarboxylase/phosphopantothenate--cysteine ligase
MKKTVIPGVTGGIAAYKAVDLASRLTRIGIKVKTVMTESATKFVTPLTFRSITGQQVITSLWELNTESHISHIGLAEIADVIAIVPATANTIAKLANGIADDMLSCIVLATKAPVILAPAMNVNMFENEITQENITKLLTRNFTIINPAYGRLASGKVGMGRLADLNEIVGTIQQILAKTGDYSDKSIIVTAGGTQEPIDPVRHIGNRSSGKMGYALAEAARNRGAKVTLISASTNLPKPVGIKIMPVRTAIEMKKAVTEAIADADVLIMAAAVADYQPKNIAPDKIKKEQAGDYLHLELVSTPDILAEVGGNFIKVGFAAESKDIITNAQQKLHKKQLDLIVANDITARDSGFSVDTNKVTIISKDGAIDDLPLMSKREVADIILDKLAKLFKV